MTSIEEDMFFCKGSDIITDSGILIEIMADSVILDSDPFLFLKKIIVCAVTDRIFCLRQR